MQIRTKKYLDAELSAYNLIDIGKFIEEQAATRLQERDTNESTAEKKCLIWELLTQLISESVFILLKK